MSAEVVTCFALLSGGIITPAEGGDAFRNIRALQLLCSLLIPVFRPF